MIYHGEINQLMRGFTNSWLQISESPMVPLVPLVLSSDGPVGVRGGWIPPWNLPAAILWRFCWAKLGPRIPYLTMSGPVSPVLQIMLRPRCYSNKTGVGKGMGMQSN